jgi:ferredoxin/flavodoxin---NADP+ reductase
MAATARSRAYPGSSRNDAPACVAFVNTSQDELLEIHFNEVEKRPPQPSLASLESGDWVWVSAKANGVFTLEQIPDAQQLWMIATGTALGVYLSILRTEATWTRFQTLLLVHNVRKQGHFSTEKYH